MAKSSSAGSALSRAVQRTVEEIGVRRKAGYAKVVLAGQSFGGSITLEAADTTKDVWAVVAMAPGVRSLSASGSLDASITDRLLARLRAERIAVVFPRNDALFGNLVRGPSAEKALARRAIPYLLQDETTELQGHGGGTGGRFAYRYGRCLLEFLSAAAPNPGCFTCPAVEDPWTLVRELGLPTPFPRAVRDVRRLPEPLASLSGWWYGLMEDTIVAFALDDGTGPLRAAYRWVSNRPGAGVYDATIEDAKVKVVFQSKQLGDAARGWRRTADSAWVRSARLRYGYAPRRRTDRLPHFLMLTEMPAELRRSMCVSSCGCLWSISRKTFSSRACESTLCARIAPPDLTLGKTSSKYFG